VEPELTGRPPVGKQLAVGQDRILRDLVNIVRGGHRAALAVEQVHELRPIALDEPGVSAGQLRNPFHGLRQELDPFFHARLQHLADADLIEEGDLEPVSEPKMRWSMIFERRSYRTDPVNTALSFPSSKAARSRSRITVSRSPA